VHTAPDPTTILPDPAQVSHAQQATTSRLEWDPPVAGELPMVEDSLPLIRKRANRFRRACQAKSECDWGMSGFLSGI
jgi:hypothetical protein